MWDTSILMNLLYFCNLVIFIYIDIYISLLHDQAQEQEISFLLIIFIDQSHYKGKNTWERKSLFKINSKCQNICGMTRLKKTNLDIFIQCQHKNHFKKRKYGTESD